MENKTQLLMLPTRSQALISRRVRYYTRKLAEIERFIEGQGVSMPDTREQGVSIHRYWQQA